MATITPSTSVTRGSSHMPPRTRYLGRKTRRIRELHHFVFAMKGRSPNGVERGAIAFLSNPFVRDNS